MENKYDVIIIGAGLAGCTLGYLLRKQGRKVLIIEKLKLERKDKLCGGIITEKSMCLLQEIFNSQEIEKLQESRFNSAIIHNKQTDILIDNISFSTVYRKNLDQYVLNQYLGAGGDLLDETAFQQVDVENKTIKTDASSFHYDYLVGADGVFSPLRKLLTKKRPNKVFCMEVYQEKSDQFNQVEFFFDKKLKGYQWIIPNENNVLVGVMETSNENNTKEQFDHSLSSLGLDAATIIKRGAYLPEGNDILVNYGEHVFFIGDSAGLILPITGEGIYYALFSAKILSETMNLDYVKRMKPEKKRIRRELMLCKFVYNSVIRDFLFSRYHVNDFIRKKINSFARSHILG